MVVFYTLVGIIAGMLGFVIALGLGASLWFAMLTYSLVGATSLALFSFVLLATGKLGNSRRLHAGRVVAPEAENRDTSLAYSATAPSTSYSAAEQVFRILAVDDDPLILGLLPKIAVEAGCPDITLSSSGLQAIEAIETSGIYFDCLLLDIDMPGLDGIDLCARIRDIQGYRNTPIIMLTSMADMDHIERAFRAGATDYTTKPFDIIALGDRLQDARTKVAAKRAMEKSAYSEAGTGAEFDKDQNWRTDKLGPHADVAALIKYDALHNYLTRLSGPALTNTYVMAVLVESPMGSSRDSMSMRTFNTVTKAIDDVFTASEYLMAYTGLGEFVLVANSASLPNAAATESMIQEQLKQQYIDDDTPAGHFAAITLGSAVRPGGYGDNRARTTLQNAITLAYSRSTAKRGVLQPGNVRPFKA